jgi:hypothetical protein
MPKTKDRTPWLRTDFKAVPTQGEELIVMRVLIERADRTHPITLEALLRPEEALEVVEDLRATALRATSWAEHYLNREIEEHP